jgi:gamma-glutamylputrescine oxidase
MAHASEDSHPPSYYAATVVGLDDWPAAAGEIDCDVCVVGGGLTGLSSALHLAERGYAVALLEARRVGWGASGRNGGQLGSGQRKDQFTLERMFGRAKARQLWDLAEEAKATVKERIARHKIACDLKPGVLSVAHKPGEVRWYYAYTELLRSSYGYEEVRHVSREELREMLGTAAYHGGKLDMGAAHLHPLNFALGLAHAAEKAGVAIFEQSPVSRIVPGQPNRVEAGLATIRARHVVLACNGYLDGLEPRIAGRMMPINNFIIATEPLGEDGARDLIRDDVAVADSKFVINYFRLSADRRLLFGGGETYRRTFPADIAAFVRPYMLQVYPQLAGARIDYAWGGALSITLKRLPGFGRLDGDIYYAHGFSGHGLALTTLAGKVIAEAVAGSAERFDLFAGLPQPSFPGGTLLRFPLLVVGMLYYALRDRL